MDKSAVVIVILAIAIGVVTAGLALTLVTLDFPIDDQETYKVTYELNGGTSTEEYPSTYTPGDRLIIPVPMLDSADLIFQGWYLDEDFTDYFDGDTTGMRGDIKLYACWADNLAGLSMTFAKDGYCNNGINSYTIGGSLTCTYLYLDMDKQSYYIRNDDVTVKTYTYFGKTDTLEESNQYWAGESERTYEYLGQETISTVDGDILCDVSLFTYPNGSTETHWSDANGWKTYKMEVYYKTATWFDSYEYKLTLTYSTSDRVEIADDVKIDVYTGYGITVTGTKDSYSLGETIVLTASTEDGISFKGWYDGNFDLLSTSTTLKMTVAGYTSIYAMNTDSIDITFASDTEVDLDASFGISGGTYEIMNADTAETVTAESTYTFSDGGMYVLKSIDDRGSKSYYVAKVTGDVDRTFTWKYNGLTYTVTMGIDYDDYLYAKNLYSVSERQQSTAKNHAHDKTFVNLAHSDERMAPYMEELVDKMLEAYGQRNISESALLNYALTFTQYIEYQSDLDYMGTEEYWKFPLETLFDQGGDCEDTSILFCAIALEMKSDLNMKYKVAMLLLPEHMAGTVMMSDDKEWSYCETTTTDFKVGEIPPGMKRYASDSRYYTIVEVP